jgi:tetratricopeptide (TPR) repeat protein
MDTKRQRRISSQQQQLSFNNSNTNSSAITTTTQPTPSVNVGGVSLKYILQLANNHLSQNENATMIDFIQLVIKPTTKDKQESYYEYLAREQPDKVKSTADHFISHVWSYKTKDELLSSLKYTLLDKKSNSTTTTSSNSSTDTDDDVYIWLDTFCINQHQQLSIGGRSTPEQLQHIFYECFKTINSFVMVLVNWQDPEYAKRSWCVFEAYMARKAGMSNIILAMSPSEEQHLIDVMIRNQISQQFLQTYLSSVDVESAKAKEPADEQAILQLIREFGVSEVNSVILGNLKQWMVQGGDVALKTVGENTMEAGKICMARYAVYTAVGEVNSALEWAEKALNIYIKVYGLEHQEVATAYNNVGARLRELGRLDEALVANDKAFTIYNNILGADDPATITARSWKANILKDQGKLEEALVIFDEVLQSRRRVLGEHHPNTVLGMANKADCLRSLKQYDKALPLFEQILVNSKRIYDENHPEIASAIINKALCLQEMGRPEEALPLYDQCIAIVKKIYGEIHPVVANSYGSKAECLRRSERFNDALPLYDQALNIYIQVYGSENHCNIATTLNNKALCLELLLECSDEAEILGKQAVEIAERVLGLSHHETVLYRENWG